MLLMDKSKNDNPFCIKKMTGFVGSCWVLANFSLSALHFL